MRGKIMCSARQRKNGEMKTEPLNKKDCCYIMQDDNLTPLLTVREVMLTAAELKLEQSMSRKAKFILCSAQLENDNWPVRDIGVGLVYRYARGHVDSGVCAMSGL
ncbi:hypothetical protein J6590_040031 [Homalodisca vitripennis]|nr:hypothetical protein J6590_040031 [Homalodisca vitripennis]